MRSLSVCAVLLMLGAPLAAATQYVERADASVVLQIDRLHARVDAAAQAGRLPPAEAESLRAEIRKLRKLERQYGRDGMSPGERAYLERRIDGLSRGVQER